MIFRRSSKKIQEEDGFTLPEVVMVLGISAMFVGLILYFGISYWRYGILLEADSDTLVTRLNVQDFIREQLGTATGLTIQNGIPDNAAQNPDPTIPGNEYWLPIHAVPGTFNTGGTGTTPIVYYKRYSTNSSNNLILNGAQPYEDEFVMYMDNVKKQLLVRTLANPNAPGNKLVTSCPPASATDTCPADKVIGSDLASVSTRYFSRSGNLIDYQSTVDPLTGEYIGPDYPSVEVIELTVRLARKPIMQKTNATRNTTVVRIALRNT